MGRQQIPPATPWLRRPWSRDTSSIWPRRLPDDQILVATPGIE